VLQVAARGRRLRFLPRLVVFHSGFLIKTFDHRKIAGYRSAHCPSETDIERAANRLKQLRLERGILRHQAFIRQIEDRLASLRAAFQLFQATARGTAPSVESGGICWVPGQW
jgi:hypothetical protein